MAVDLRKAFDNVSQKAILQELAKAYPSVRGQNWIRAFLQSRPIRLHGSYRGWEPTTYYLDRGVPQGFILGPVLFNLAITGVAGQLEVDTAARCTIYADDVTVWTEAAEFDSLDDQTIELQAAAYSLELTLATWDSSLLLKRPSYWRYTAANHPLSPRSYK